MIDVRVISIGALDAHPLWNERSPVRTGHATTTLISTDDVRLLVDPALPGEALTARLSERANLEPSDITHVFLTSFRPDARRALPLFDGATWWISEAEREQVGVPLIATLQEADEAGDDDTKAVIAREIALLQRTQAAPDKLAPGVDLFPLPGVTPGLAGLLIPEARHTTLIAGDAIPTAEHLHRGIVPRWAAEPEQAKESLLEGVEIADLIIPGRDNLLVNPSHRPF
jgi:glyoxylase-like metal-dependent hydrolase (beta-lactamase superfamily II)